MKPVKAAPRFRCDHCHKTGVKATIKRHESRCFRNPERFCDACQNTGKRSRVQCKCTMYELIDGPECTCPKVEEPCPYCEKYRAFLAYQAHIDGL